MIIEEQISERQERAKVAIATVRSRPDNGLIGDYQVTSASGKSYRVAIRGPGLF